MSDSDVNAAAEKCPACGKRRDEPSVFCSAVHPIGDVNAAADHADTNRPETERSNG